MSAEHKPTCVVIDTNIWIQDSSLLLKTAMGSALLYILKQSNGKIGLPEIIEEELTRNTVKKGIEAVEAINKNFKAIEVIMGSRCLYEVPDKTNLEAVVKQRLTDLDDLIIRVDFTFEHAKSALRRINEKSQPNGEKNQQFKDSAIWEAILTLLSLYTDTVHFITNDQQFFKDKQVDQGKLATNLYDDSRKLGGVVHIYKDMASCVKFLQKDVPQLDYSTLILEIDKLIKVRVRKELLAEVGVEIVDLAAEISSVSAFFIEIKDNLALSFELCYLCTDVQNTGNNERKEVILKTKGNCLYEFETQIISELKMDFERIYWVEPSGEAGGRGVVYVSATIGGSEQVNYTFREPVDFIRSPDLDRKKRVDKIRTKQDFFKQYSKQERAILEIFLDKYMEIGFSVFHHISDSIRKYPEFADYGDATQIVILFGDQENLEKALTQLQNLLYSV